MAGIYIHIPFCNKICHYCDFYKTANTRLINPFVEVLLNEIEERKEFINEKVFTIYFGGGTPSVLNLSDLNRIIYKLQQSFDIAPAAEITLEVNPDDVNIDYYKQIQSSGINRLSIGIQSFNDNILKFLNRRHNSESALKSIENAISSGFERISCDLIYGIPGQEFSDFQNDLNRISNLNITHLSAYHLGIEEGTYFGKMKSKGKISDIDEAVSYQFYKLLINWSGLNGYDQYEVSNFASNGHFSGHNMNYWFGVPYLGFGPSAHSFNGVDRFYNDSNLNEYLNYNLTGTFNSTIDKLDVIDNFNEYLMLRLRTKWGIELKEIKAKFPALFYKHILNTVFKFKQSDYLSMENNKLVLTNEGFFVSDYIIREFFITK